MKANLKNLSLARGSLENLAGREHTADYKKRTGQIHNLEESIKNNPVFQRHDLLESREPFLYDAQADMVLRKGDIFMNSNGIFTVEGFKYKKQELECRQLMTDSERLQQEINSRKYGYPLNEHRTFSIKDLGGEGQWKHNKATVICEKADPETAEVIRAAMGDKFYNLPEKMKEQYYETHLTICSEQRHAETPLLFLETKDGKLKLETASRNPEDKDHTLLNPFSDDGRKKINTAIEKGVEYYDFNKDSILESLEKISPALKTTVNNTMEKQENAKQAEEIAKREALQRRKQAAREKLGIDVKGNGIEKRIHVTGVEITEPAVTRSGRKR